MEVSLKVVGKMADDINMYIHLCGYHITCKDRVLKFFFLIETIIYLNFAQIKFDNITLAIHLHAKVGRKH